MYWSHFGTYRVRNAAMMGVPPLTSYDELARHAEDVKARGFRALKTNILPADAAGKLVPFSPGFGPQRRLARAQLGQPHRASAAERTVATVREAIGPEMGLMLDVNFHFKSDGFRRIADAIAPYDLTWLEIDTHDPDALADIRSASVAPIASCETLTPSPRLQALFRGLCDGRADHRRGVERARGIA